MVENIGPLSPCRKQNRQSNSIDKQGKVAIAGCVKFMVKILDSFIALRYTSITSYLPVDGTHCTTIYIDRKESIVRLLYDFI